MMFYLGGADAGAHAFEVIPYRVSGRGVRHDPETDLLGVVFQVIALQLDELIEAKFA